MGCDLYWFSFLSFVMQFYVGKYMVLLGKEKIVFWYFGILVFWIFRFLV